MQKKLNKIIAQIKARPDAEQIAERIRRTLKIIEVIKFIPNQHLPGFYLTFSEHNNLLQSLISGEYVPDKTSKRMIKFWTNSHPDYYSTRIGLSNWYNILQHLNDYLSGETKIIYHVRVENVDPLEILNLSQEIKQMLIKLVDSEKMDYAAADNLMILIQEINKSFDVPESPEAPNVPTIY